MTRRLVIATDEAGYGPNLGPLVVTATAWELPAAVEPAQLWQLLDEVLTNQPRRGDTRLHVADSKEVHAAAAGVGNLERSVLAMLPLVGCCVDNVRDLGACLSGPGFAAAFDQEPCHGDAIVRVPVAADPQQLTVMFQRLRTVCEAADVRLLAVRSRILFPEEFNRLVAAAGSKGIVLSQATMQLASETLNGLPHRTGDGVPVQVVCDKHGGRNRYDELISEAFGDEFVFRQQESTHLSRYRMGRTEFIFRTRAEELLPVAVSSMVSKYLRELLMEQFNLFWQQHIPSLKPTKGYPVDARRFLAEIKPLLTGLAIPIGRLWRER